MASTYLPAARLRVRPGARAEVVDYPPGSRFGPRTLDDFELVWLLAGSATRRCASRVDHLRPGSVLLARPGEVETYQWDPDRPTRHAYVHFDFTARPATAGWPVARHPAPDDLLAALCRHLLWLRSAEPPGAADRFADVLPLLLSTFLAEPASEEPPIPAPILAAVGFLRERWAAGPRTPVRNAELAAAANVSPSYLARLFRVRFHLGPAAAVELLRLSRAADLLRRSNLPLAAIAGHCGFADAYHFSRRFRAAYGIPPRRFRLEGAPPPVRTAALLPLLRRL